MESYGKKKVALVFSGAVSLGSFEAGVAYELIKHVQRQEKPELGIDVIVGTSAGALTGALAAACLVFGLDPGILEEAWLSVRLEDLLNLDPGERSLLSGSKVEKLIARYIGPQVKNVSAAGASPGTDNRTRTGDWTGEVSLGVIVTNLDGIKYSILSGNEDDFGISAIGYEDAMKFRIGRNFGDWDRLRTAVRASSAYPVAFEPKRIERQWREYSKNARHNFTDGQSFFHYSDGGIVNNQPLNTAIEMVSELPDGPLFRQLGPGSERIFLVIDPSPPESRPVQKEGIGVFDVAGRALWTIPRNQTLYRDLLFLEKVNRRLRWKNSLVSSLADTWSTVRAAGEQREALRRLCHDIALFKGERILGIPPERYLEMEMKRLRQVYGREAARVTDSELFLLHCFLLEQVADLRDKQEIAVEMIRPHNAREELAGVIYGNFGGFLDSGFMRHDYNVGRAYARRWLEKESEFAGLYRCPGCEPDLRDGRKLLQKLIDNSVPLIIEEVGPRIIGGTGKLPAKAVGMFNLMCMFMAGAAKYAARRTLIAAGRLFWN